MRFSCSRSRSDRSEAAKARFLDSCHGLLVPPNCNSGELVYYVLSCQIFSGVAREPRSMQQFCGGVMSRYTGDMSNGPWDTRNSQVIEPPRCISRRNDQLCFYFATPITIALPLHCHLVNCSRVQPLYDLALTRMDDLPNARNSCVINIPTKLSDLFSIVNFDTSKNVFTFLY